MIKADLESRHLGINVGDVNRQRYVQSVHIQ